MNLSNNGAGIFFYNTTQSKINNVNTSNNSLGIGLFSSSSNTIISNNATYSENFGISLDYSFNNTVNNNKVSDNTYGIILIDSDNNTLNSNNASSNIELGIGIGYSNNSTLKSNHASENYFGIYLYLSDNTTLINNTAKSNFCGIILESSSNNILYSNNIKSNNYIGFSLTSSNDNTVYNNYFNNTNNAMDDGNNTWNITKTAGTNILGGPWLGGNYWSDYAGADIDGDLIGDTLLPYDSSANITFGGDYMPLFTDTTGPVVTINPVTTPTNLSYQVISGTFTETGSGIASIIINNVTADIIGNSYSVNITLTIEGYNPVNVTALDNASNTGTQSTSILRDTTLPIISAVSSGSASNNSVTIYWNTNEPGDSMVKFGLDNNLSNLTLVEYSATLSIDHSVVLTGLNNSTQYYYVVNSTDLVKNSNQTSTIFNFTTTSTPDNSSPVIHDSHLNKTTNVNIGETITVTVNVSDNIGVTTVTANSKVLTRLNATHWNGTITADSTKTITIVAYDGAGNSSTSKLSYTLYEKKSTPSGGGGGGGSGNSGEEFENIICTETDRQYISKDSEIGYTYELGCNVVEHINFTGLTSSNTVAAKVEILNHTSSLVNQSPPNIVYKNLNIFVGNYGWATDRNINSPTIVFMVEKSWVNENNIDISTITMYRYHDEKWNPLSTKQIREDTNILYFEANTPGFSSFAIAGQKIRENIEPTITTPTSEPTTQSTPLPSTGENASRSSNGLGILAFFVGLCGISIATYLKKDEISQWWQMRKI